MKLETAIRYKVIIVFAIVLVTIAVYLPTYGVLLAIAWLGIVIWQAIKQSTLKK